MQRTATLTTGEVAAHCQVSTETVANWIKSGKLNAFSTPGRHRRILVDDFKAFLQTHNMPPWEEGPPPKPRILIVDDEPGIVQLITQVLSRTGPYELAAAADGFDAGLQLTTFGPDLVVLDLMMPNIDGFEVCRRIKSHPDTQHIAVLVVTAYAQDENIQKALECGADYCMSKPFDPFELVKRIDALIQRKHQSLPMPRVS